MAVAFVSLTSPNLAICILNPAALESAESVGLPRGSGPGYERALSGTPAVGRRSQGSRSLSENYRHPSYHRMLPASRVPEELPCVYICNILQHHVAEGRETDCLQSWRWRAE